MTDQTAAPVVDGTTVYTRATTYTVTCLPDDQIDGPAWDITVQYAGAYVESRPVDQQWSVRFRSHWCLSRAGTWDIESRDGRDEEWFATHRFGLEEALKLAAEQAPLVKVCGMTAAKVLAWRAEQ